MPVPEAAVNKYHSLELREHDIRRTRQLPVVLTEPEPQCKQAAPQQHLWLGDAFYMSHVVVTLSWGHGIHGFEYNTEPDTDKQKINKPISKPPLLSKQPEAVTLPGVPFAGSIKMISVYLCLV